MNSRRRLRASGGARSVSHFSKASGFSSKRRATSSTSCCVATDLPAHLAGAEGERLLLVPTPAPALALALTLALALAPAAAAGELASLSENTVGLASAGVGVWAAAC